MLRLSSIVDFYVRADADAFLPEEKIHKAKMSYVEYEELVAYYGGEPVTSIVIKKARRSVVKPNTPLPREIVEGRTIRVCGTDGEFTPIFSFQTLARIFRLFHNYLMDMPDADSITFNYPIDTIRQFVLRMREDDTTIYSSNLALVLQLDPFYIAHYSNCVIDLNYEQMKMLVSSPMRDEGLMTSHIRKIRYISYIVKVESPLLLLPLLNKSGNARSVSECLRYYPSAAFDYLSWKLHYREAFEILMTSDFSDYKEYRQRSMNVMPHLNDVLEAVRETITKQQLITIMTKLGLKSNTLGNENDESWLPYRSIPTKEINGLIVELMEKKLDLSPTVIALLVMRLGM